MPLYPTSFFLPASAAVPFLMEDIYLRGGYRCVNDVTARDAIPTAARKAGMRVFVISTGETWTVNAGALSTWVKVSSGPSRSQYVHNGASLAAGASQDFTIATGKTAAVLKLTTSHANLRVEAHSTNNRSDTNPYTFLSYTGHLSDDGSSKLDDGTTQYNRRYAIVVNLDATPGTNTYWRVVNEGGSAVTPAITIDYLTIES